MLILLALAGLVQNAPGNSLEELRERIRETFREEYTKRDAESRRTLARRLLALGRSEKESVSSRTALLLEARDLCSSAGDVETGVEVVRELGALFGLGGLEALEEFLDGLKRRSGVDPEQLLDAWLRLSEEAEEAENFGLAEDSAAKANVLAGRSRDSSLRSVAKERYARMKSLAREHRAVKPHLETLKTDPDDPEANERVGAFTCFTRGDWEAGLAMLAKGADADLAALAKRDRAGAAGAGAAAMGDAWWNWARKIRGARGDAARARAVHWYETALDELGSLDRIRVEKRIDEYYESAAATAGGSGRWPGSSAGVVFSWADSRSRRCPGEFRGAARYGRRGEMVLGRGAFAVAGADQALLEACRKSNALFVEAAVLPDNDTQFGPARIVTFSSNHSEWNFTLGQSRREFTLRLRTSTSGLTTTDLGPLRPGRWQHVIVTYRPGVLACYVDGKPAFSTDRVTGDFSNWKKDHLVFGDDWPGQRDWAGSVRGIVIGSRFIEAEEAARRFRGAARFLR